jgi:hypothetical protein
MCNTFNRKVSLALRGNLTLGFNAPCSADTLGSRCIVCGLFDFCDDSQAGPKVTDIYLFQIYGKFMCSVMCV